MKDNLFQKYAFTSHAGRPLEYKIECDALTDDDWATLAFMTYKKFRFSSVFGIPRGGLKFAKALHEYTSDGTGNVLIVDDVLTTGGSMEKARIWYKSTKDPDAEIIGVVAFARNKPADWIHPIFQMWEE